MQMHLSLHGRLDQVERKRPLVPPGDGAEPLLSSLVWSRPRLQIETGLLSILRRCPTRFPRFEASAKAPDTLRHS